MKTKIKTISLGLILMISQELYGHVPESFENNPNYLLEMART